MATGPASAILAALKTKAAAAVIAGAVVVGGGATAVAVTTGAIHLPGQTTATQHGDQHSGDTKDGGDARVQACATNGDAQKLAVTYKAMFGGSAKDAQDAICQAFVNASGEHAVGLGEIRQALDLAAWIESKGGATVCLTATPAHGDSSSGASGSTGGNGSGTGDSGDHGKSGDHGDGSGGANGSGGSADAHGQPTLTIPSASTATTESVLKAIFAAEQSGRPIAQMVQACGAPHGVGDAGTDNGGSQGSSGDGHGGGGVHPGPTPEGTPEAHA